LRAWRELHTLIQLQIIGDGPMRFELEQMVEQDKLSNVFFAGHLGIEATRSKIQSARILILPSECYENFPMTVVEALSCGTPVVCSRLGGMEEIITDHCNGLHFTPGDSAGLATVLEWAWSHPQRIRAMGKSARQEFEQKYTAECNYQRLIDIYQKVISSAN
jgi:glycosyltransferase involved in cell wall biosynthesis